MHLCKLGCDRSLCLTDLDAKVYKERHDEAICKKVVCHSSHHTLSFIQWMKARMLGNIVILEKYCHLNKIILGNVN